MIIDCFTFWKEFDILEIRLNELYNIVDYFILVEASYTQSMMEKPYYFEDNKHLFKKYLDKIIHVKVDDYIDISNNKWAFENHQRRCIERGFKELYLSHNDYIMVSDLDEIPNSETLLDLIYMNNPIMSLGMSYHVYYLNLVVKHKLWAGTVIAKYGNINCDMHEFMKLRDKIPNYYIPCDAGWHLGYQGGPDIIFDKYFSCIEPFNKQDIPSKDIFYKVFEERAKDNGSFIFCDNLSNKQLKLKKINDNLLPKSIINNYEKYKNYILTT